MDYKHRLQELMKIYGIENIWEFSRRTGVPATTLDGLLYRDNRVSGPRFDTILKICGGLGITLGEFMGEKETTEEKVLSRLNFTDEELEFIKDNMHDPGFQSAIDILRVMPSDFRLLLQELCLLYQQKINP